MESKMRFLDLFTDDKKKKDDLDDDTIFTVLLDTEKEMLKKDLIEPTDFSDEVEDEDDYYYEDEN
jgi:hypothetical protein